MRYILVYVCMCCVDMFTVLCMYSNPVQGQTTLTFRGRSRRNKEDVNEVLYQEDIEVSVHMYSHNPNDLQHTSTLWLLLAGIQQVIVPTLWMATTCTKESLIFIYN